MEIALLYDFYGEVLTEKQQNMVDLYYNNDLSLAEIAENEGITRQGVRDSVKRAETQLLEMEERLHLAQRFKQMHADFEQIERDAREIAELNDRTGYLREIAERADRIQRLAQALIRQ